MISPIRAPGILAPSGQVSDFVVVISISFVVVDVVVVVVAALVVVDLGVVGLVVIGLVVVGLVVGVSVVVVLVVVGLVVLIVIELDSEHDIDVGSTISPLLFHDHPFLKFKIFNNF